MPMPIEKALTFPLYAFIEPFQKHARRIEVRNDNGTAVVVRYDLKGGRECPVAWRCIDRSPDWFVAHNGGWRGERATGRALSRWQRVE